MLPASFFVSCHPWEDAMIQFVENLLPIFVANFGPIFRLVLGAETL